MRLTEVARVGRLGLAITAVSVAVLAEEPGPLAAQQQKLLYRKLAWTDFPVDDRTRQDLEAWTHAGIDYNYRARYERRRGQYLAAVAQVQFTGYFDPSRSWRKTRIRGNAVLLLEHEQGHFDINELAVRRLRRVGPETFPLGVGPDSRAAVDDLDRQLKGWFDDRIEELQRDHARYDEETDHGRRRGKQAYWTLSLEANLRATQPPPAQPAPQQTPGRLHGRSGIRPSKSSSYPPDSLVVSSPRVSKGRMRDTRAGASSPTRPLLTRGLLLAWPSPPGSI